MKQTGRQNVQEAGPNYNSRSMGKVFREYVSEANGLTSENSYNSAVSALQKVEFVLGDVKTFAALACPEFFSDKANYWTTGLFLSAAINKVIKDGEMIALSFEALGTPADCIGYKLRRGTISVQGDVGDYAGEGMAGGAIMVDGNAGNYAGYRMSGGRISIRGNAGDHLGTYMSGGILNIDGAIGSIPDSCHGRVYHKEIKVR